MAETHTLQVKDKQEIAIPVDQTRPGRVFTPAVDIFETDRDITLLADLPGVAAEDVGIDLREGFLTLTGEVKPWEGADESDVLIEFEIGRYFRQFALSETIDQESIEAKMQDGVIRLVMPKAEKAVPRRIAISAS